MSPKTRCTCGLTLNKSQLHQHQGGKRHRQLLASSGATAPTATAAAPQPNTQPPEQGSTTTRPNQSQEEALIRCTVCGVFCINQRVWEQHMSRPDHANATQTDAPNEGPSGESGEFLFCETCETRVSGQWWSKHVESAEHRRREQHNAQQQEIAAATVDRNGIRVSAPVDFGIVELGGLASTFSASFNVTKTDPKARVVLLRVPFTSALRHDDMGFSAQIAGDGGWINYRRPRTIVVTFKPTHAGRFEDTIELHFLDIVTKTRFVILRQVQAVVGSQQDQEELKPKAPYVKPPPRPRQPRGKVITLQRPPSWSETIWVVRLAQYPVPKALEEAAGARKAHVVVKDQFMPQAFHLKTYGSFFETLLWVEEDKQSQDLDKYSMQSVELVPEHPRYRLEVPGLAEKRPSVLVGDFIQIRRPGATDDPWYQGIVHQIYGSSVTLSFPADFNTYRGNKFDVRFVLNRLPVRRMHQAVTMRTLQARILFPDTRHPAPESRQTARDIESITLVNRIIGEDEEQREAIAAIMNRPPGSIPFILFGPPGTGKTTTLVEAIKQLLYRDPDVKILACAPSNSAADNIALSLLDLGNSQLFRLNSFSREYKNLPKSLQEFSLVNESKVFSMPKVEVLQSYRVVVSTCITAGAPHGLGIRPGHFTYIFIDEAGQATEPETAIPLNTLAGPLTNVVIAGDNQQLGPILHSPVARDLGMRSSFLDRLMDRPAYDLETKRGLNVIKLIKNWRSHPDILKFANEQFYGGELIPCGDQVITHSLLRSSVLAKARFPVVFHAVNGRDQREESSPSFFNIDEATIVKNYCMTLLGDRSCRLKTSDIGVISPYRAQCGKILQLFSRHNALQGIKVSSVEEFQGQERRVIILSTVRSNQEFMTHDLRHSLGFVASPRRFNVAITRAQALLIVVGDPQILSLDPIWRSFLNYVHVSGGWKGKKPDWDTAVPVDFRRSGYEGERRARVAAAAEDMVERLRSMIITANEEAYFNVRDAVDDISDDEHDDPAWRDDYQ